jgi:hypothetical protein
MTSEKTTYPWDRQPGESAAQYKAFCFYLYAEGSRSIISAYRENHHKMRRHGAVVAPSETEANQVKTTPTAGHRQWGRWCSSNRWVERAAAYDSFQIRRERERLELERERLANVRIEAEIARQSTVNELVDILVERVRKIKDMPATDVEHKKLDEEGNIVAIQKIRGLRPESLARLSEEAREAIVQLINGPGGKYGNRDSNAPAVAGTPVKGHLPIILVDDEWPEGQAPLAED